MLLVRSDDNGLPPLRLAPVAVENIQGYKCLDDK